MEFALTVRNQVLDSLNSTSELERLWPFHPVVMGLKWLRMCGVRIDKMIEEEKARVYKNHVPRLDDSWGID